MLSVGAALKKHEAEEGKRDSRGGEPLIPMACAGKTSREEDEVRVGRQLKDMRENIQGKGTASANFYFRSHNWVTCARGRGCCMFVPKLALFTIYT